MLFIYITSLASNEKFVFGWGDSGFTLLILVVAGLVMIMTLGFIPASGLGSDICC